MKFDWNSATDAERAAYNAGYAAGADNPRGEAALRKIMNRLGIIGATYGDIADQVCKRLDGCEEIIDEMTRRKRRGSKR